MMRDRTSIRALAGWLGTADRAALAAAGLIGVLAGYRAGGASLAVSFGFLVAAGLAITLIDGRRFLVPDLLSLPLFPLGLLFGAVTASADVLPGRAAASLVLALGLLVLRRRIALHAGRPALGLGDVKLMAAAALWMPPGRLPLYILCASAGALVEALVRDMRAPIAFGRHLSFWLIIAAAIELR
jgi:leader peptidase (prepilin peptidase)/N-methyltransferase